MLADLYPELKGADKSIPVESTIQKMRNDLEGLNKIQTKEFVDQATDLVVCVDQRLDDIL